jgi:glycosidase
VSMGNYGLNIDMKLKYMLCQLSHMKLLKTLAVILSFIFFSSVSFGAKYEIDRLEPPSWWVGMQNPMLQLLIYGDRITELQPHIAYKGVSIERVVRVKNPNYVFINLIIKENTTPVSFDINFKKNGKVVEKRNYQLLPREEGSSKRQGFNGSDVIYLITPDRYVNGNPDNDSKSELQEIADREDPDGRHGGDIEGIINHLDYIADLGFTAIWTNPVLENNQPRYSYHGYSITDFYKVDARFGSNGDYKKLGDAASKNGIKLIMDMIFNHCGSDHWWMNDLPASDWINSANNYVRTNHRRTTVQDPYACESDHKKFVDGWFVPTMPDLNQRNPLVATYLIQNSIWWIEYAGLAGIRMDTYSYPDMDFMADWTQRIMEEYPNFNIVGEEWSENPALVAYWQRGKANPNDYTSSLPSLMDFPLQGAIRKGLTEQENGSDGFIKLYEMLANDFLYADPFNLVIFLDNHDMSRFYTQVREDYGLFKLGLAYVLTMRGIPQIYYGTEILMANPESRRHGIIRSDFPGGWKTDTVNAFKSEGLTARQQEAKGYLKKLLNWRKNSSVIHNGKLVHYVPENGIYVYFRYKNKKKVMVILNKKEEGQQLDIKRFNEMLEGISKGKDVISDRILNLNEALYVPSKTALILELD